MGAVIAAPLAGTRVSAGGVATEIVTLGNGTPLLFLHGGDGPQTPSDDYLHSLAVHHRVHAPFHPGFGPTDLPDDFRDVADLAYFYLDLADELDLRDAVLVGSSFGGWIAAEIAIRNTARFSHLVLIDPVGIKVGDRETRDIADIYALERDALAAATWHDPAAMARETSKMSDADVTTIVKSREALCYYAWQPYMHNPQLRRWLHRIDIPTLVLWGESDGIVTPAYGRAFAAEMPGARFETIAKAGHFPQIEQPEAVAREISAFVAA